MNGKGNSHANRSLEVGGTGLVGQRLVQALSENGPVLKTSSRGDETTTLRLDLATPQDFDFDIIQPGWQIYFTAAASSPDFCARQYDLAWSINVEGTKHVIEQALERGARVAFLSSDTVYGEKTGAFSEGASCHPAGVYAEMKYAVEQAFRGEANFKSARLSYVFGRDDKFTRYLHDAADNGETVEVFHPFLRAVVHIGDVIEGLIALARSWEDVDASAINFGGPEVVSRAAIVDVVREVSLPHLQYRVVQPPDSFFDNRPRVIHMESPVLADLLGRPLRSLRQAANIEFLEANT